MKALVKTENKNEFVLKDREKPTLGPDDILVKIHYCGVCGSDLHAAAHAKGYEFVPFPIVFGHEASGTIVETGPDVDETLRNKRVIIRPGINCGTCEQCLSGNKNVCTNKTIIGLHVDGAMAEYVRLKQHQILIFPHTLPFEIAALNEPLSVGIHAVERIGDELKGKNVLVQGSGIIGMFTAISAKDRGANVTISGLRKDWEHRLSLAEIFNIQTKIYEDAEVEEQEYDFIFECSGSSIATESSIKQIKRGGTLILVALYEQDVVLPLNIMVRSEIDVLCSYGSNTVDFKKAVKVLDKYQNKMKKIISLYPLERGGEAFKDASEQKVLKPILKII